MHRGERNVVVDAAERVFDQFPTVVYLSHNAIGLVRAEGRDCLNLAALAECPLRPDTGHRNFPSYAAQLQ